MGSSQTDRDVLNVFRELEDPHEDTLTTDDLVEQLPVKRRAVQNYVRDLEKENRLVLEQEGKPNHWRLAKTEPSEPVYDAQIGKAKRWGNKAKFVGNWSTMFGIAILAAAGIITSNRIFSIVTDVGVLIPDAQTTVTAGLVGVGGSLLFLIGFIAYVVSFSLPRVVEWWINRSPPSEDHD